MCEVVAVAKWQPRCSRLGEARSLPNPGWKSPEKAEVVQDLDIFA